MPRRSSASGISASADPQSLPAAHGFDEFYGIPPDTSGTPRPDVPHDRADPLDRAPERRLSKGAADRGADAGGPLQRVKPFTPEVRAEIDNELTDKSMSS